MTAIGIGWGITWFVYAADYTRFTRPEVSGAAPVLSSRSQECSFPLCGWESWAPISRPPGGGADPAQLVIAAFGALALPVLLLILHGPIATNIVVMYSSVLGGAIAGPQGDTMEDRRRRRSGQLDCAVGVPALCELRQLGGGMDVGVGGVDLAVGGHHADRLLRPAPGPHRQPTCSTALRHRGGPTTWTGPPWSAWPSGWSPECCS